MKTLFLVVILVLLTTLASAATLNWDTQSDATGFILYHHIVDDITIINELDVGNVNVYDLDILGLTKGVRYEFFLRAYNTTGISTDSNHIQWTYPVPPLIIKMASAPVNIMITP